MMVRIFFYRHLIFYNLQKKNCGFMSQDDQFSGQGRKFFLFFLISYFLNVIFSFTYTCNILYSLHLFLYIISLQRKIYTLNIWRFISVPAKISSTIFFQFISSAFALVFMFLHRNAARKKFHYLAAAAGCPDDKCCLLFCLLIHIYLSF